MKFANQFGNFLILIYRDTSDVIVMSHWSMSFKFETNQLGWN